MADPIRTIRMFTFAFAGLIVVICCGGLAWHKDTISGAFTLNAAQGVLDEAVRVEAPAGSKLEILNVSDRSGAVVVGVPSTVELSADDVAALQDSVWGHYTVAFASGGYAVSHVAVVTLGPDGALSLVDAAYVDVRTLAERTGKPAPALHPVYEASGLYDPATDEPPEFQPRTPTTEPDSQ